ncbi:hypothetical protein GPJ56_002366 [Histomonas meleagridis]|uniref:uncharacterized protein n=1 Tax=Histomonas meleagridis TaxID=135588 RepID=UPI003559C51E|nr:hypothetical protein GPJ56_002366 [Histomonas meleagridis]KAH0805903.1 hypothetical protein GO595_001291 [Histomonas meleagridis]
MSNMEQTRGVANTKRAKSLCPILTVSAVLYRKFVIPRVKNLIEPYELQDKFVEANKFVMEETGENYYISACKKAVTEMIENKNGEQGAIKDAIGAYIQEATGYEVNN